MDGFVNFITDWKALFGGAGTAVLATLLAWLIQRETPRTQGVDLAVKALTGRLQEKMGEVAGLELENKQLIEAAEELTALEKGGTEKAEEIFQRVLDAKKAEGGNANKEAAAARHIGALAFLHDTAKALNAYRQAVALDPDDPDGWNMLGQLLARTGDLDQAIKACEKVLPLGNRVKDKTVIATATGNLGIIHLTRGDLGKAEDHCLKALNLNKQLDSKEGMAANYGNLGAVAEERGDKAKACQYWARSKALFREVGIPYRVEQIGGWMAELGC